MEKINIGELLKDCPTGMELDCILYDNIYFDTVGHNTIKCYIQNKGYRTSITFDFYGGLIDSIPTKCVIFPKGKTTWEGFQRPFKDGDIIFYNNTIAIFKEWGDETLFKTYVTKYLCCDSLIDMNVPLFGKGIRKESRFATDEEKQKLFDAIKTNGYKWNPETKTLEKLIEPKFKVGDKIVNRNSISTSWIVSSVSSEYYGLKISNGNDNIGVLPVSNQDDWELTSIVPKFKVGDKIRHKIHTRQGNVVTEIKDTYYILDDELALPFTSQDEYELVPNKFDINTLKPFDKVLVRDNDTQKWTADLFSFFDKSMIYPYSCVGHYTDQCIPYEENKHLLGTTNDCDDYYKNW